MAPEKATFEVPAVQVEAYRAFRDETALELRPLTLLYGRNQAGKSSLLRLLPLLSDSIFGNTPVLDLKSPAALGATFKELGWLGPNPQSTPTLRISAGRAGAFMEVQLTEQGGIIPNRLQIGQGANTSFDASWDGSPKRLHGAFSAPFRGVERGQAWAGELEFRSFMPEGLPEKAAKQLEDLRAALRPLERIQWLTAARSTKTDSTRAARCCFPDGSDLAGLLGDRKDVHRHASSWMESCDHIREALSIERDGTGEWRLHLQRSGSEKLPEYLAGEGLRWLAPILLCASWAEVAPEDGPTMLAIEELESKLHPIIQLAAMDRLLDLVTGIKVPCVLETHSVYVLRKVQLAVVSGKIPAKDVGIYWVERAGHAATVRSITIREDGTLDGWLPDSFEEEQRLSREIFEKRWKRGGGA